MHPLLTSTALGLIAAWPVGLLGLGLGRSVERLTDDPRPRAAVWSLAHALPAGALAATIALTFAPAPPGPAAAPAVAAPLRTAASVAAAPRWTPETELMTTLAWSLVGLSAVGLLARGWRWNRGRRRLAAIRAAAQPCQDAALVEAVRLRARRLNVTAPPVGISADIAEPLLAGARRPVILLPWELVETTDARGLELVCGHELAHLRRGDNWRIPVEEALAGLFWLSPPVAGLRSRMLAAREAVCDQTALDGAAPEARRDYARVLVDALKINAAPAPQSAFTGRARNLVRLRLSAILRPQGGASAGRVGVAVALGGLLTAAPGAGSVPVAALGRRRAPPARAPPPAAAGNTRQAAAAGLAPPAIDATALSTVAADAAPMRTPAAEPAPAADAPDAVSEVAPVASEPPAALASPRPDPRPAPQPQPQPNPDPEPRPDARASVESSAATQAEARTAVRIVVPPNAGVDLSRRIKVLNPDVSPRVTASPKVAVDVRVSGERDPWAR